MQDKLCAKCQQVRAVGEFYVRSSGHPTSWCKACVRARAASVRAAKKTSPITYNATVDVWSHRHRRYGITREQFDEMWEEQGHLCAICRRTPGGKGPCVDHDHKTGKVRGILCLNCNHALGQMLDDPDFLMNAITYLEHGFVGDGRCS